MTVPLTAAERRAVEQCEGGVWLAMDNRTVATIWPRVLYPSLDEALVADSELGGHLRRLELDLEDRPYRARLAWAWEMEPGRWSWTHIRDWMAAGFPETVECWEITWL